MRRQISADPSVNVFGEVLEPCGLDPITGFFRNGSCDTCAQDAGSHTVCAVLTEEFLAFSKARGNDLTTPRPEFGFAGLSPGDRWCLCAARWREAYEAGHAPNVVLTATHQRALSICSIEALKAHALDLT
ncbi:MAG: DUF2237 domain-containing protein [Pseudomonadota bacterium]